MKNFWKRQQSTGHLLRTAKAWELKNLYILFTHCYTYIYRDFVFKIKKAEGMQVYIVLSRFTSLDF